MTVRQQFIIWALNVFGFGFAFLLVLFGLFLSVYNVNPEDLSILRKFAEIIGGVLTFAGVMIVASTAWTQQHQRPPDQISKKIFAPAIVVCCLVLIVWIIVKPDTLSVHITNGVAIIGITGAIMRFLPFTNGP